MFADSILNTESNFNSFRKSEHKDKDSTKPSVRHPQSKKKFPATMSRTRGKQAHSQQLHVGSHNMRGYEVQNRLVDDYQELSKASKASIAPTSGNGEEATLTTGPSPKPKKLPNLVAAPSLQSQRSLQKIYRKSNIPKMPTQDQTRSRTIRNISPLAARPPIESAELPGSDQQEMNMSFGLHQAAAAAKGSPLKPRPTQAGSTKPHKRKANMMVNNSAHNI